MIGIILLITLLIGLLALVVVLIYSRQSEVELTDRSVDLGDVLPIQTITEDAIINGNGDITVGYRLFLPEVFTLSESDALYIHERLEALLKMLPAGTVVHQQNFYYTGEYRNTEYSTNALIAENNRHFDGKEILNSYSNLYVTFTNGNRTGKLRKSATSTSLLRKQYFPFKQPYKDYPQRLKEMEAFLMNFENGLASIQQFEIRKMSEVELNNAIYDYINLSYENPETDATQKAVNPMAITKDGTMKIGQQYVAMLSLTNEGEHLKELNLPHTGKSKAFGGQIEIPDNIKSKCSMLYPLGLGLPFNHIVNVVIEITDPDATVTAIGAEKDALNYITNFYPPAAEKQREQEAFCNEITKFDYQTAYTAFNVILNDTDHTSLMRKIALAQQGYSFMNQSSCYVENAELCNLFFTNIPGNARSNYRGFVNTTKQAICYLQKEGMYLSDAKGHIYNDRFGTPVKINLWDYPTLNNKNRIVIGPSGSGKSFWLNNYILQSYELGRDVMIIDIGGGTTEVAVVSLGGVVESESIKTAGDAFDEAIVRYVRRKHNILIGKRTAEELKIGIACLVPRAEVGIQEVKGRCLTTGLPKSVKISSVELVEAIAEPARDILETIHMVLERTPPELVADVAQNGIIMAGGGSLIYGFDQLVEKDTGIRTTVVDDALSCAAFGSGKMLMNLNDMQDGMVNLARKRQMKA